MTGMRAIDAVARRIVSQIRSCKVLRQSLPPSRGIPSATSRRCAKEVSAVLGTVALLAVGVTPAPSAVADPVSSLRDAVSSARSGTSCGPLRYNATVERAAEIINRSTDTYLNQEARRVPVADPLEGLKDLGYHGTKAYLLQGADKDSGIAIKGALLEGYAAIPDCSYTEFGASMRRNESTGYNLASLVLAG
jgi:hypothetical protein